MAGTQWVRGAVQALATAPEDPGFRSAVRAMMTEPRLVTAVIRLSGDPGREQEAAEAWAFELTYYFTRGVGEAPQVTYENGVYTVTGLMQTTHPHDTPVTDFSGTVAQAGAHPSIDDVLRPGRVALLRDMYPCRRLFFDGRDHPAPEWRRG